MKTLEVWGSPETIKIIVNIVSCELKSLESINPDIKKRKKKIKCWIWEVTGLPRWLSGKESACQAGDSGWIPELGRSSGEKEMATHSSILAWEISWTEDPGGYQGITVRGITKSQTWLSE